MTLVTLGQDRDGALTFATAEGQVVPGPLLGIGNTTSRVDFGCDPGEWVDAWSVSGTGHHWALCLGRLGAVVGATAELMGLRHRHVDGATAGR